MTKKERYLFVLEWFQEHMPNPETELHYRNPYELLVAVILSAQCTDKRVNIVTPSLFEAFPTVEALAQASFENVEPIVRSISFANNKTRHLLGMAQRVVSAYNGEIPDTVDALVTLPGVGRKTANVITSVLHQQPNMAVDTHVFRVSERIGLTIHAKTPLQTEQQLIKHIPQELVHKAHHWLILHGRYICLARRPKCEICGLRTACKYFQSEMKQKVGNLETPQSAEAVRAAMNAKH